MEDLQIEERGKVLVVNIEGNEICVPKQKAEEVAKDWGITSDFVAQMYAIIMYTADAEENARGLSWKKFKEGYRPIVQIMPIEELISRMIDDCGYEVLNPDEFYEMIKIGR